MANTIPNITIPKDTVVDIYNDPGVITAGIAVGDQIIVSMEDTGNARLFTGAAAPSAIDNSTGFVGIKEGEAFINDAGDSGAFIWSLVGCVINVTAV